VGKSDVEVDEDADHSNDEADSDQGLYEVPVEFDLTEED
jgi:hypothetical protein